MKTTPRMALLATCILGAALLWLTYRAGVSTRETDTVVVPKTSTPQALSNDKATSVVAQTMPKETLPLAVSPSLQGNQGPWQRRFESSNNYAQFIRESLSAALANDRDAQYVIAKATRYCQLAKGLYNNRSPQDIFGSSASFSAETRRNMQQQYDRCSEFIKHDPFADLPATTHGYNWQYWLSQASANGDVTARLDATSLGLVDDISRKNDGVGKSPDAQFRDTVLLTIKSRDPTAIVRVAALVKDSPSAVKDAGFALSLAACGLGMPCNGPEVTDPSCESVPNGCIPGATMEDYLLRQIGDSRFGRVKIMADRLLQALNQNDQEELQAILFVKN